MSILKNSLLIAGTMTALAVVSGCNMCKDPIAGDPSCVEATHLTNKQVSPDIVSYTAPKIAPCTDVFRPTFRAGTERVGVIGTGNSLEEATSDAVQKFIEKTKCDYIVAVTRSITMKTHPTWRFFSTTNYSVSLFGIPLYLEKVVKVENEEGSKCPKDCKCGLTEEQVRKLIQEAIDKFIKIFPPPPPQQHSQSFGLLKLSDINVQIQAKGSTQDGVGVAFPAPPKAPKTAPAKVQVVVQK